MNLKSLRSRKSLQEKSDDELVALYRRNRNALVIDVLFRRYTHKVLGLCLNILKNRAEAEDAAMEIFESLFHKLDDYEIKKFTPWLYQVTRNHCLKILREKLDMHREDISEINPDIFVEFGPDSDHYTEELLEELSDAIDNLKKEDQRRCLVLFYFEQKSYQDIVSETEFTLKQVKSHIQNGRRNLKNSLIKTT